MKEMYLVAIGVPLTGLYVERDSNKVSSYARRYFLSKAKQQGPETQTRTASRSLVLHPPLVLSFAEVAMTSTSNEGETDLG